MTDDAAQDRPLPPSRPFLITLVILLIFVALLLARPYLGAIALALLVAFMVHPLHRRLLPHVRWPSLSASLLLVGVCLLLIAPLVFVVWQTLGTVRRVFTVVKDPAQLESHLRNILSTLGIKDEQASAMLTDATQRLAEIAAGLILPTLQFILHAFLALVVFLFVLFFAIRDGDRWIAAMKRYTPLAPDDKEALYTGARESIWAIVMGTFVVSIVQGVIAGIGWWFFGFPDPFFWGFVMVVFAVLPFLGAFVVAVPAGILAILSGDYFAGIGLIVYTIVVVGLSDDLLRPYLIGRRSGVTPVFILVGALGGIAVFGVAGFVLGPLLLALLPPVLEVWGRRRRELGARQGLAPDEPIH